MPWRYGCRQPPGPGGQAPWGPAARNLTSGYVRNRRAATQGNDVGQLRISVPVRVPDANVTQLSRV